MGCYSRLLLPIYEVASAAPYAAHGPLIGPCFESAVVERGGGTLLWFKAGRADCLEIYAFGDYFPADHSELGDFRLESQLSERWGVMRQKLRTFRFKLRRALLPWQLGPCAHAQLVYEEVPVGEESRSRSVSGQLLFKSLRQTAHPFTLMSQ